MKTIVTDSPQEASTYIRSGETAAFPTETVYGLGADATNPAAVARIFAAKGRPYDNPLIVHIGALTAIEHVVAELTPASEHLIEAFFPGPLTLVLPKRSDIPRIVTAGLETVGIRMPSHPVARAFLQACAVPVAAPSANRSGRPSPTSWRAVLEDLDGRISCVLKGGRAQVGLESTVVDCTSETPLVLRAGAVALSQLRRVVPSVRYAEVDTPEVVRSPGMRHRHYAPAARVEIVPGPPAGSHPEGAYIGLEPPEDTALFKLVEIPDSLTRYAFELFHFMRACDDQGVDVIYCQRVEAEDIGAAIMDRLLRAAEAHAD